MAVAAALPATITSVSAGDSYYPQSGSAMSPAAQREMIRRREAVARADQLLVEGREAYAKGDFQVAVDKLTEARNLLPDAPLLADRRAAINENLSVASVALAQEYVRKGGKSPALGGAGTLDDARKVLEDLLKEDPNNVLARRELGYIDDPIRTNPAADYKHTQNVDAVRRHLYTAQGAYDLGKFDQAKAEYEKVLRIDPYNTAARRGMETVASAKSAYYRAAYDETRAEMLSQVDKAWEMALPAVGPMEAGRAGEITLSSGAAMINEKLRRIIIPQVNFEDITVEEAIDFLRLRSQELDVTETDPSRKGVDFVIRGSSAPAGGAAGDLDAAGAGAGLGPGPGIGSIKIRQLRVSNMPLGQVLKYICDLANPKLRYSVDDFVVTILPFNDPGRVYVGLEITSNRQIGFKIKIGDGFKISLAKFLQEIGLANLPGPGQPQYRKQLCGSTHKQLECSRDIHATPPWRIAQSAVQLHNRRHSGYRQLPVGHPGRPIVAEASLVAHPDYPTTSTPTTVPPPIP